MTWTQQCGPRNFCCFPFTPAVYECQDKLFPCTGSSLSSHPADSFCSASSQPPPPKPAPSPCASGAASCSPCCSKPESAGAPEVYKHYLFTCISLLGALHCEMVLLPRVKVGCLLGRHSSAHCVLDLFSRGNRARSKGAPGRKQL